MRFCFGDIVVVEGNLIGVVVKSWCGSIPRYDVYVREFCAIVEYAETEMERYLVRHKYLDDIELEWQRNAVEGR